MFCAESVERILLHFAYLITLGKDVTLQLITKFKGIHFSALIFHE